MKKIIRREKEFSTETLIDVNFEPEDVKDYDSGKAPVSRKTQQAEELEDLAEFQRRSGERNGKMKTHNYNVLNAVKEYDPDAERREAESRAEAEARAKAEAHADKTEELPDSDVPPAEETPPEPAFSQTEDSSLPAEDVSMAENVSMAESTGTIEAEGTGTIEVEARPEDNLQAIEEEIARDYEPRPLRPEDAGYEDIMEQFTAAPTKPKYWFEEFGDYWSCSCGHLNKGEYCTNCGITRDLLRSLFVLHKPGEEPGEYEGMPVKVEEIIVRKGRLSTKAKLIIAIAVIAILLLCAAFFTYYYMIIPAMEKQQADEIKTTTEAVGSGVADSLSETDKFFWNSYISAGDASLDDNHYDTAISYYAKAQQINDNDELKNKVLEAKYQYVDAKQEKGGEKFERYLDELVGAGYKESQDIYDKYYAWHFTVVTNLQREDYSSDIDTAGRADVVYFHVLASGGPPDGSMSVYYEMTEPSGHIETHDLGANWVNGSKDTVTFVNPIALLAKEGTLKFVVKDKNTNEVLASDSIEIKK